MGQKTAVSEREVTLQAADGVKLPAFVAEPEGATQAPRIVIAPEIFGVSPWVKSVARRLAHDGFRAIAPELFVRDTVPLEGNRASWMARIQRLDIPQAVRDLRTAADHLGAGKAGVIGFCLGGALALLTAPEGGFSACVSCYGRVRWAHKTPAPHPVDAAARIECPVLGIYGKHDAGIPIEDAEQLRAALPGGSELVLYDAGHAFLNDTRPDMYDDKAAAQAWPKITGFLRRNL